MIHPTAIVAPSAEIHKDVKIGAYSVIGENVSIGEGTEIAEHVCVQGRSRIGAHNRIFPFAVIGGDPQDKKYQGEADSVLEIGDHNTIREYVTISRGSKAGGGKTALGNHNLLMTMTHVAHDCVIGDHTVLVNGTTLAGHVQVQDYATLSASTLVHQFCRIGRHSFVSWRACIAKDVPPFLMVTWAQDKPKAHGLNKVGLNRHGFSKQAMNALNTAYRCVYSGKRKLHDALRHMQEDSGLAGSAEVQEFRGFIEESESGGNGQQERRGIIRPMRDLPGNPESIERLERGDSD